MKMKAIVNTGWVVGLTFIAMNVQAQTTPSDTLQEETPLWVETMYNDSTANYKDAVEDFEEYWETHEKPTEGEEEPGNNGGTEGEELPESEYALEYKHFLYWKMINEPYVQQDGRVLTKDEKLKLWKQLRK